MTDYLIKNFPERSRPPAAIIDGPAKADIRMWDVPTLGSRPHDPLAARDSSIWWTGQLANKLGRLDPKTGAIREYTLKSPLTGPHGLAEDKSGNIWFTGNSAALIGKLDPSTGLVTEYPLPDASAKDPHTLNFDQSGILWFTVQQANMIGRLDPATGAIKLVTSPTPKSNENRAERSLCPVLHCLKLSVSAAARSRRTNVRRQTTGRHRTRRGRTTCATGQRKSAG